MRPLAHVCSDVRVFVLCREWMQGVSVIRPRRGDASARRLQCGCRVQVQAGDWPRFDMPTGV